MQILHRYLEVESVQDVFCVHLKQSRMEEAEVHALGDEFQELIDVGGCRKLVLDLGSNSPSMLFSLFLGKLVMIHRRLLELKGAMRLCAVNPQVMEVFAACQLDNYFDFAPDRDTAVKVLAQKQADSCQLTAIGLSKA